MKKHMQTRVSDEEFREIKKAAIDASVSVEAFLKDAALHKIKGTCNETEIRKEGDSADQVDSKTNN